MKPDISTDRTLLRTSRFRVVEVSRRAADGSSRTRAVIRHPGAVTILPLVDPETVCLIRNFRVSVGQTLIELPAGTLEPGEDPQTTAQRELAEETGFRAGRWQQLRVFYLSPGVLDERMHLFLATELVAGPPAREPGEEIETLVTPWGQALAWIDSGEIHDAKTIAGLLLYDRLRRTGAGAPG
jgi:ADP-ribose pyrophosphatase